MGTVSELKGTTNTVEKSVQMLFESNLEPILGVRSIATEFTTTLGGRIDTLGLDENGCSVMLAHSTEVGHRFHAIVLDYKRSLKENVINKGPFYPILQQIAFKT